MIWYIPTRFCFQSCFWCFSFVLFVSGHDSSRVFMLNAIDDNKSLGGCLNIS